MTISEEYVALLDHLGPTRPVRDLLGDDADIVALRHDVDHDLDLALEMAFWEHRRGHRATYFLLPSAPYWGDELLDEKVLQLADYGHEVGLHLNGLAEWADGRIDDVEERLRASLGRLRSKGVDVVGSSAHGDKACYEHGVINNWVFAELRPDDTDREDGLSAEGVPSPDPAFRIPYSGDVVTRADGKAMGLWSVSMADVGLRYEAVRLPMDGYFSDSGGSWSRTPDPRDRDLSTGRHQVLVHPEYYRGPQRFVFVLSTARSGSKWMATALGRATNASVTHEHTLNHVLDEDGEEIPDHRTGAGFTRLLEDRGEIRRRIAQVRAAREEAGGDHIECNVYLPHCLDELREVYPDAVLLHLHRDPYKVVRSLLNREWYDTPLDDRHPQIDVDGWEEMSQLEKCCAYITAVSIDLALACPNRIDLEQALAGPETLTQAFGDMGVAVHGRLSDPVREEVVNASTREFVPPVRNWPPEQRRAVLVGLGQANRILQFGSRPPSRSPGELHAAAAVVLDGVDPRASAVGGDLYVRDDTLVLRTSGDRHAYVLLGGGMWKQSGADEGWAVDVRSFVEVQLSADVVPDRAATVFGLTYDHEGNLLAQRRLTPAGRSVVAGFRPRPDGHRWNIGVHVPMSDGTQVKVTIRDMLVTKQPLVETTDHRIPAIPATRFEAGGD